MVYGNPNRRGPSVWLIFLVAGVVVFGGYFVWIGVRDFFASGLRGVAEATEVAVETATANAPPTRDLRFTPPPSRTPVPDCQDFVVTVPEAIIRECASTNCAIEDVRHEGNVVCVLERDYGNDEWLIVNLNPGGFVMQLAYMHEDIIRAMNPTLTPSLTMTPLPTVTSLPTDTPLPTPRPSDTPNTATPPTITPTFTATATPPLVSG